MELTSFEFSNNEKIPSTYTCDGDNINPPLEISEIPEGTKSLVLIVDDPDAPAGTFDHWIVFNIPPETTEIARNSVPARAVQGTNSAKKASYSGPCPPLKIHRYMFKLYALDTTLDLTSSAKKSDVESVMEGHILAQKTLTGIYSKNNNGKEI